MGFVEFIRYKEKGRAVYLLIGRELDSGSDKE